jgi:multidrug transporter EmrE-like cation transporter
MRNKIICLLLITIGLTFTYMALKSDYLDIRLGYSVVAIVGFVEAYVVYKRKNN